MRNSVNNHYGHSFLNQCVNFLGSASVVFGCQKMSSVFSNQYRKCNSIAQSPACSLYAVSSAVTGVFAILGLLSMLKIANSSWKPTHTPVVIPSHKLLSQPKRLTHYAADDSRVVPTKHLGIVTPVQSSMGSKSI